MLVMGLVLSETLKVHQRPGRSRRGGGARGLLAGLLLSLGTLGAGSAAAAPAVDLVEPASGQRFTTPLKLESRSYTLIGSGLRAVKEDKQYVMALYVEDSARQSFGSVYDRAGRSRAGLLIESRAQNFFSWGHFAKLAIWRFLRATPKDEVAAVFREGLVPLTNDKALPELKKDALAFLALLDKDLKEGEELRLHVDDVGHLDLYLAGVKKAGPQSPKLVRQIWDIWLGYHPVSPQLRVSLVNRLEVLGK